MFIAPPVFTRRVLCVFVERSASMFLRATIVGFSVSGTLSGLLVFLGEGLSELKGGWQ